MSRPRVCIAGPLLGSVPGWVVSQGEILAERLRCEGFEVCTTSSIVNRYVRPLDICSALLRWRNRVDVVIVLVFARQAFTVAEATSWLTKMLGKRLILWLHGGNLPELAACYPSRVQRVLDRADEIVVPSEYLMNLSNKLSNRPVAAISNIIDVEKWIFKQRAALRPHLLWMRTFHDVYRPELAVEVLRLLIDTRPDAQLTMAGQDKGTLADVRRAVIEKDLDGRVRFAGFLDDVAKRREFAAHDIYLNTTAIDNMPVSLLEAAAFGLPIVTTSVGGIPMVFSHGDTALLVEDDASAIAASITRLLDEPLLASRLSSSGRQLAESCAWTNVGRSWCELLDRVSR